jgi:YD repeat-containing protein
MRCFRIFPSARAPDLSDLATTDPVGNTTTRTYDRVSRLVTQTDPLGRLTWYTYDANGNLLTVQDALGQTTPSGRRYADMSTRTTHRAWLTAPARGLCGYSRTSDQLLAPRLATASGSRT